MLGEFVVILNQASHYTDSTRHVVYDNQWILFRHIVHRSLGRYISEYDLCARQYRPRQPDYVSQAKIHVEQA